MTKEIKEIKATVKYDGTLTFTYLGKEYRDIDKRYSYIAVEPARNGDTVDSILFDIYVYKVKPRLDLKKSLWSDDIWQNYVCIDGNVELTDINWVKSLRKIVHD